MTFIVSLCRVNLRLNAAGFQNRFRAEHPVHVDKIYNVMYPDREAHALYTDDPNRVNRRQNVQQSRYDIMMKVNGPLHVKLINQRQQVDKQWHDSCYHYFSFLFLSEDVWLLLLPAVLLSCYASTFFYSPYKLVKQKKNKINKLVWLWYVLDPILKEWEDLARQQQSEQHWHLSALLIGCLHLN